jgi:hypothetical protein
MKQLLVIALNFLTNRFEDYNADFKKNKCNWTDREKELILLLDKHRRNDGRFLIRDHL